MSVNEKMTAIADGVRTLSGESGKMGLDAMSEKIATANTTVDGQSDLIHQIKVALRGKAAGGGDGADNNAVLKAIVEGATTEIRLPNGIENIKKYLYYQDTNLTNIQGYDVNTVGNRAFYGCNALTSFTFPAINNISDYAFHGCKALAIPQLPECMQSIGEYAFYNCSNLAWTVLPQAISTIKNYTFYGCTKLALMSLPTNTQSIGTYAFYGCKNITLTELPNSIQTIGTYAFYGCNNITLTSLPENLKLVAKSAFNGCTSLTSILIHESTYHIASYGFSDCSTLSTLILKRKESVVELENKNAFNGTPIGNKQGYIYVPSALIEEYKTTTNWSTYANQFRAIEDYPDVCGGTQV